MPSARRGWTLQDASAAVLNCSWLLSFRLRYTAAFLLLPYCLNPLTRLASPAVLIAEHVVWAASMSPASLRYLSIIAALGSVRGFHDAARPALAVAILASLVVDVHPQARGFLNGVAMFHECFGALRPSHRRMTAGFCLSVSAASLAPRRLLTALAALAVIAVLLGGIAMALTGTGGADGDPTRSRSVSAGAQPDATISSTPATPRTRGGSPSAGRRLDAEAGMARALAKAHLEQTFSKASPVVCGRSRCLL